MEPFGRRGNDPDAKLLALVTQWDTCPAAPARPPPIKTPESNRLPSLFAATLLCACYVKCCCILICRLSCLWQSPALCVSIKLFNWRRATVFALNSLLAPILSKCTTIKKQKPLSQSYVKHHYVVWPKSIPESKQFRTGSFFSFMFFLTCNWIKSNERKFPRRPKQATTVWYVARLRRNLVVLSTEH